MLLSFRMKKSVLGLSVDCKTCVSNLEIILVKIYVSKGPRVCRNTNQLNKKKSLALPCQNRPIKIDWI